MIGVYTDCFIPLGHQGILLYKLFLFYFFQAPRPNPFDKEEFLLSLPDLLTSKTKGDWVSLYKRFFQSPNFIGWYDQKLKDIQQKLTELHLEKLSQEVIYSLPIWVEL